MGCGAPVVPGKAIGKSFNARTARYAKAWASMASVDQPTASADLTLAGARRSRSIRISVGLRAPPPATTHERGGRGKFGTKPAIAAAVNAVSVAAPSAVEPAGRSRPANALRSSDFGGAAAKNG